MPSTPSWFVPSSVRFSSLQTTKSQPSTTSSHQFAINAHEFQASNHVPFAAAASDHQQRPCGPRLNGSKTMASNSQYITTPTKPIRPCPLPTTSWIASPRPLANLPCAFPICRLCLQFISVIPRRVALTHHNEIKSVQWFSSHPRSFPFLAVRNTYSES